jgi:hypothetical protein
MKKIPKDPHAKDSEEKVQFEPVRSKKPTATVYSVYVSQEAQKRWDQGTIEFLVFFHGDLGGCFSVFDPDINPPKQINKKKFNLDQQIERTKRPLVLVVPFVYWNGRNFSEVLGKWTADNFNRFIDEAMENIRTKLSRAKKPTIKSLIIAGHSRAHGILTPLACEFFHDEPATKPDKKELALANLKEVWALDSTYGCVHVHALDVWARKRPDLNFKAVLSNDSRAHAPLDNWNDYYGTGGVFCPKGFDPPPNLRKIEVTQAHCVIPMTCVETLLKPPSG